MKAELIEKLKQFETDLRDLRKDVKALTVKTVNAKALRERAEELVNRWVEELRSPLEHKFKLDASLISTTADQMKRLSILSRPSNLVTSYTSLLDEVLDGYKDKFILPIQQTSMTVESVFDLQKLVDGLTDPSESDYLKEAVDCANAKFKKASIVMGWCAAIDHIQRKVGLIGFARFNAVSTTMKNQTQGKFRQFNKEFKVTTVGELQTVFDTDLIRVCECMGLFDGNESDRLITVDFQWRNHSAHPGNAPIEDPHLVAFFTDINKMILTNPKLSLT